LDQTSLLSFGSLASDATLQNVVTIDATAVAMGHLEDMLVHVKVKLVHLHARFTKCEKLKGRCEVTLTYSTGQVELSYKWAYQLVFVVLHENQEFHGKLHLSHMTKENVFADLKPYPQEITWQDGISPTGVTYNQVVAVLQSSKCRNMFREGYKQFEESVVAAYMPRFQQGRAGAVYKNLEGKKAAVYDLKEVSRVISDMDASFAPAPAPAPSSASGAPGADGHSSHPKRSGHRGGHRGHPHTPPLQQHGSSGTHTPPRS